MDPKEKLYTKLMRIRYNDKLFDIFVGEDHRKTFLEVRTQEGKESYYYPILKDYIALNNVYNKPFDGVLHAQKYSFKSKVIFATYVTGISLVFTSLITEDFLNYKLQKQALEYEIANKEESFQGDQEREIVQSPKQTEQSITSEIVVDPSFYYQNGSQIMIYNNEALTAFGIPEVSFEDVKNTLAQNQEIQEVYRKIMVEFLGRVEERLNEVDLRVLNNNWKDLRYEEDLKQEENEGGNFNLEEKIIHLKEKYINPTTGEIDEEKLREVVYHELCHTLNYGKIEIIDPETLETKTLYKFFRRTNYGESFSEGFTTILADYLLADSIDDYFAQETHAFGAYQITTPMCYQIMKLMNDYNFYDFINKDVIYFDKKVKEHGFQNAISILDTYMETIDQGQKEKIEIVEANELETLLETIIATRIELEITNQSSTFKILTIINEIPLDPERKFEIARNLLSERSDEMIQVLRKDETKEKLKEGELEEKGINTFKIYGENQEELLDISPKVLVVYKTKGDAKTKYRLAYYGNDQEFHDCETGEIIEYNWQEQLDLLKVLPQMDLGLQTKIVETKEFEKKIDQKFEEQDAYYKRLLEEQQKKEIERNKIKEEVQSLIESAIAQEKGDLEICRMLKETQENVGLAMDVFGELKPDRLIWYRKDLTNRMITVFRSTGEGVTDSLEGSSANTHFIYQTEEQEYRLGKIVEKDGVTVYCDYLDNCPIESVDAVNGRVNLIEILPEVNEHTVCIQEEFFSSLEFLNLMNQRKENNNQIIGGQDILSNNQK